MKASSEMIRDISLAEADVVLIGVPYEGTVSGEKGTAKAPRAICRQLKEQVEEFDLLLWKRTCGEVKIAEKHLDEELKGWGPYPVTGTIREEIAKVIQQGLFPVVLGGEHTVSLGAIQAAHKKFPDLTVVQFDAHADMRDHTGDYEETWQKIAHSTVMRRVYELGCQIVQIGIRSMSEMEYEFLVSNDLMKNVIPANFWGSSEDIIDQIANRNVWLTVDVDVFSGADFPGTGTFEPGGIGWDKFMHIANLLFCRKNVVGFDVVEVIPDNKTDYAAAKLVYNLIGRKFSK